ncbi:hypothetical protein, partial [Actinoplanes sp. ATCC 53533]|uniref:hypothetical protein n=1 Tax=Actinoplanes sp. ATCC 53533 TaxID=1288362 RepID=UPI001F31E1B1
WNPLSTDHAQATWDADLAERQARSAIPPWITKDYLHIKHDRMLRRWTTVTDSDHPANRCVDCSWMSRATSAVHGMRAV